MDIDQQVTELLDRGADLTPYQWGELRALLPKASPAVRERGSAAIRQRTSSVEPVPVSEVYQRGLERARRSPYGR